MSTDEWAGGSMHFPDDVPNGKKFLRKEELEGLLIIAIIRDIKEVINPYGRPGFSVPVEVISVPSGQTLNPELWTGFKLAESLARYRVGTKAVGRIVKRVGVKGRPYHWFDQTESDSEMLSAKRAYEKNREGGESPAVDREEQGPEVDYGEHTPPF